MITNLVEQGKRKCEQYWPETGSLMLGLIEVTMVQESVQAHCTVRTLRLRHTRLQRRAEAGAVREATQHQYTSWPDHGTPTNIAPVLSFIKKSSAACQVRLIMSSCHPPLCLVQESEGPLLVHCSAGVGRTGTYIVIDAMLKQLRAKGEINIASFLSHIRHQRAFLVQTEDQFRLIHDTLGKWRHLCSGCD